MESLPQLTNIANCTYASLPRAERERKRYENGLDTAPPKHPPHWSPAKLRSKATADKFRQRSPVTACAVQNASRARPPPWRMPCQQPLHIGRWDALGHAPCPERGRVALLGCMNRHTAPAHTAPGKLPGGPVMPEMKAMNTPRYRHCPQPPPVYQFESKSCCQEARSQTKCKAALPNQGLNK